VQKTIGFTVCVALVAAVACGSSSRKDDHSAAGGAGEAGAGAGGKGGAGGSAGKGGAAGQGGKGGAGGMGAQSGKGGGAGSTFDDCVSDSPQLVGAAFTVYLRDPTQTDCCGELPVPTSFHFEQGDAGLELVIGTLGQAYRGSVTPEGSLLVVEPGLRVHDDGNPHGWTDDDGELVKTLSLCFHPARDSEPLLDGTGTFTVIRNFADEEYQFERDSTFTGARWDDDPPVLYGMGSRDPLEFPGVDASEPLVPGAVAALDDPPDTMLEAIEQAGVVVGFRAGSILPLGLSTYVSTTTRDLAGNAVVESTTFVTDPDPGIQPFDGFESAPVLLDKGTYPVKVVTGDLALEGEQSLEVPGGGRALMHLARPTSGAKHLRLDLKRDSVVTNAPATIFVRAGVVGGAEIVTNEIPIVDAPLAGAAGAAGSSGSSDVVAVDLELSDPGDDILLEISAPYVEELVDVGAIVDRLRIE
jgi:hypothetical protein